MHYNNGALALRTHERLDQAERLHPGIGVDNTQDHPVKKQKNKKRGKYSEILFTPMPPIELQEDVTYTQINYNLPGHPALNTRFRYTCLRRGPPAS